MAAVSLSFESQGIDCKQYNELHDEDLAIVVYASRSVTDCDSK